MFLSRRQLVARGLSGSFERFDRALHTLDAFSSSLSWEDLLLCAILFSGYSLLFGLHWSGPSGFYHGDYTRDAHRRPLND